MVLLVDVYLVSILSSNFAIMNQRRCENKNFNFRQQGNNKIILSFTVQSSS